MKIVLRDSAAIAFGFVFHDVPGATPKKPASGLIARRRPSASGLSQAMSSPTVQTFQPSKPAGGISIAKFVLPQARGERGGDVGLLALRVLDAEDQHVLGHPALVARDVRGDPQREALLAQQRVAAVARAVRPDLARLREVDDVLLRVARPGHVLLAGRERRADGVHAGHDPLLALVDLREDRQADPRHDPHVDDDVGRVGQLDADLRHRRADRPHAERQHVHRPAPHRAVEQPLQLAPHLERVFPVVGRAGRLLRERADEGPVLDPRDVARVRSRVIAARPEFLVELDERAALDHLGTSASYSSCEPSTQWIAAGCVSRAIFSTHLRRWLFLLSGIEGSRRFPSDTDSLAQVRLVSWGVRMRCSFRDSNRELSTVAPGVARRTPLPDQNSRPSPNRAPEHLTGATGQR